MLFYSSLGILTDAYCYVLVPGGFSHKKCMSMYVYVHSIDVVPTETSYLWVFSGQGVTLRLGMIIGRAVLLIRLNNARCVTFILVVS